MQYLLLIYADEKAWGAMDEKQGQEVFAAYNAFTKEVKEKGAFKAGDALKPTATATTVRVRNGKMLTTDGPFAETKEQLGGYYLIEAASLDEAIAWASKIPDAKTGSIEVRPVAQYDV